VSVKGTPKKGAMGLGLGLGVPSLAAGGALGWQGR